MYIASGGGSLFDDNNTTNFEETKPREIVKMTNGLVQRHLQNLE